MFSDARLAVMLKKKDTVVGCCLHGWKGVTAPEKFVRSNGLAPGVRNIPGQDFFVEEDVVGALLP